MLFISVLVKMAVYNRARLKVGDGDVVPARVRHVSVGQYGFDVVLPGGPYGGQVLVLQPGGSRRDQKVGRRYYARDTVLSLETDQYKPPVPDPTDPLKPPREVPIRVTRKGGQIMQGTTRLGWAANPHALHFIQEGLHQVPDESDTMKKARTILGEVTGRRNTSPPKP